MAFGVIRDAWRLCRFVVQHPLNNGKSAEALLRTLRWQIGSRILGMPAVVEWVDGARLIVTRGKNGATGNLYSGLHEYTDMAFLLHFLREDDLFVDIGANIGSYTILAASVCGANTVSFEPVPATYRYMLDNVRLNGCEKRVQSFNMALGDTEGVLAFTADLDAINHVASSSDQGESTIEVPVRRLDDVLEGQQPILLKVDVEGYESMVVKGGLGSLRSAQALIIELNGSGARYGLDDEAVMQTLVAMGFIPVSYEPVARVLTRTSERGKLDNTLFVRDLDNSQRRLKNGKRRNVLGSLL